MMKVLKEVNVYTSLGRLLKLVQSFKFISNRLQRCPMDWCTLHKLGQSFRMSFSRLGSPEKSGVSLKFLE